MHIPCVKCGRPRPAFRARAERPVFRPTETIGPLGKPIFRPPPPVIAPSGLGHHLLHRAQRTPCRPCQLRRAVVALYNSRVPPGTLAATPPQGVVVTPDAYTAAGFALAPQERLGEGRQGHATRARGEGHRHLHEEAIPRHLAESTVRDGDARLGESSRISQTVGGVLLWTEDSETLVFSPGRDNIRIL